MKDRLQVKQPQRKKKSVKNENRKRKYLNERNELFERAEIDTAG